MKPRLFAWIVVSSIGLISIEAQAQVAGAQPLGVSVEESAAILQGWSVRKAILNKPVYNENGQRVGVIHDIIVAPDRSVSFAIVAANQFLGVSHHDVAIPIEQAGSSRRDEGCDQVAAGVSVCKGEGFAEAEGGFRASLMQVPASGAHLDVRRGAGAPGRHRLFLVSLDSLLLLGGFLQPAPMQRALDASAQ
jgi:PRC-barrel domain